MKRRSFVRRDGVVLRAGDWIEVDKGIGRFAGVWDNPVLGCMTELTLYRSFSDPAERTTLFLSPTEDLCREILDSAFVVTGSMKASGVRPSRKPVGPCFTRNNWVPSIIEIGVEGARLPRFGWVCGAFGIFEEECDP